LGDWTAWYTHVELREALRVGYKITKVHKTHYFKESCRPFDSYVSEVFALKNKYKQEGSPLVIVAKLFLNSLYGKFGQKFIDKDKFLPMTLTKEELDELDDFEILGNYIRIKQKEISPACFCFPEWAAYVTAYARLKMNKLFWECDPDYTDTDSVICEKKMFTSDELGDFKLEMHIKEGIICKKKMYAVVNADPLKKDYIKIKGVNKRLDYLGFKKVLSEKEVSLIKFVKFKESLRGKYRVNEIIDIVKHFDLEDTTRDWGVEFDPEMLQNSTPIIFKEGMPLSKYKELQRKALDAYRDVREKETREYLASDLFDSYSADWDDPSGKLLYESEKEAWKFD
jgi:hypothetical protein